MKILITERQFEGLLVLLEEKNQKIIDKLVNLGLREKTAIELTRIAGKISIFLAFKLLEKYDKTNNPRKQRFETLNSQDFISEERNEIQSIVDWFRVGLNGNIGPYENLSFEELYEQSVKWHNSLQRSKYDINYVEKNKVILDFRKNGIGFYWVTFGTYRCPEEALRMGHCASSIGTLYSLREYKKIGDKHTLNKSHLTMSIFGGKIFQLKGAQNKKPNSKYHKYITPLFEVEKDDGNYLITGFEKEYFAEDDFKLSDLDVRELYNLYQKRPDLFRNKKEKYLLISSNIIPEPVDFYEFTLHINPDEISDYVNGGETFVNTPNGNIDFFKGLLKGYVNIYNYYSHLSWKGAIEHNINKENKNKLVKLLKEIAQNNFDKKLSLEEMIEKYDEDDDIKNLLNEAKVEGERESIYSEYIKTLKSCLSSYGEILELNDKAVRISIDLRSFIDAQDFEMYIDKYEDMQRLFNGLVKKGIIEKPDFRIKNSWRPVFDENRFNEVLNKYLDEYMEEIKK